MVLNRNQFLLVITISIVLSLLLILLNYNPGVLIIGVILLIFIVYKKSLLNLLIFMYLLYQISGLERYMVLYHGLKYLDLLFICSMVMIIILYKIKLKASKASILTFSLIILFFSLYIVSGSVNSSAENVLVFIKDISKSLIATVFVFQLYDSIGKNKFLLLVSLIGVFVSIFGIIDWYNHYGDFGGRFFYRASGYLGNPNLQAQTIVMTLFPTTYLLFFSHL